MSRWKSCGQHRSSPLTKWKKRKREKSSSKHSSWRNGHTYISHLTYGIHHTWHDHIVHDVRAINISRWVILCRSSIFISVSWRTVYTTRDTSISVSRKMAEWKHVSHVSSAMGIFNVLYNSQSYGVRHGFNEIITTYQKVICACCDMSEMSGLEPIWPHTTISPARSHHGL